MPGSAVQGFFSGGLCLFTFVWQYMLILASLQENVSKSASQLGPDAFLTYALILRKQMKPRGKRTTQNIPRHSVR